jgi:hypothetical protein
VVDDPLDAEVVERIQVVLRDAALALRLGVGDRRVAKAELRDDAAEVRIRIPQQRKPELHHDQEPRREPEQLHPGNELVRDAEDGRGGAENQQVCGQRHRDCESGRRPPPRAPAAVAREQHRCQADIALVACIR